ncbi:MAG: YgiQ family radical SAM protein [Salinivirgaceae bacterium]|nr:YgiQ family radical SAM protein [Salinivirgaceae bacterium]
MTQNKNRNQWLPTTVKEMQQLGWEQPDVVFFSGDAYIDHPSFGTAMISRVMEMAGMKVVIVPQPNWQDDLRDFKKFGAPKYFFAVTAGCMDSMVNHYTAHKRLRSDDAYSPGGKAGFRPDYATDTYCQILKSIYPNMPIVIGGIEASQRRFTHYDYWQDKLRPSILVSSKADLLVYGMGEKPIESICKHMLNGGSFDELKTMPQVGYLRPIVLSESQNNDYLTLESHEKCLVDKKLYASNFKIIETESNKINALGLIQRIENQEIVINPPYKTLSTDELDRYYDISFTRQPHPKYFKRGVIPAYEMIRHSITMHRGCFGGCSFCAISAHQGKYISSRSPKSILKELDKVVEMPDFKGNVSDLGGPSANMYMMQGIDQEICNKCSRSSCLFPSICNNLNYNHTNLLNLYREAEKVKGVKRIFIGSGIRYDMLYKDNRFTKDGDKYARHVIKNNVSGRLKVAPEHTEPHILKLMRKPSITLYNDFQKFFMDENQKIGKKQQLIPYFISSHPGCTIEDMFNLHGETSKNNIQTEQIQDFTPTPMTLATVMFYSGINPYTGESLYVAHDLDEKRVQKGFFFINDFKKRSEIQQYLRKTRKTDILKQLNRNISMGQNKKHRK